MDPLGELVGNEIPEQALRQWVTQIICPYSGKIMDSHVFAGLKARVHLTQKLFLLLVEFLESHGNKVIFEEHQTVCMCSDCFGKNPTSPRSDE